MRRAMHLALQHRVDCSASMAFGAQLLGGRRLYVSHGSAASSAVPLRRLFHTGLARATGAHEEKAAVEHRKHKLDASKQTLEPSQLMKLQSLLQLPHYCCGCGVKLQQQDPDAPGYFQVPKKVLELVEGHSPVWLPEAGHDDEERGRRALDQLMEAWLDKAQKPLDAGATTPPRDDDEGNDIEILCARCHSLTHYGKIKSEAAEGALPEFDLAKKVGRKIALQKDRRAVVLCVVDIWDFDGSLPRTALSQLFPAHSDPASQAPSMLPFKLVVAVNKFDLLPKQATARRVEAWARTRLRQAGLPQPERVFMVSAANGFGVKEMLDQVKEDMGFRADLWVVGAQNAGKSSLISAMKRLGGTAGKAEPTIAPMPGTTLGLLRVPGVPLGPKNRTFDTPGVPHAYQLTSRLPLTEVAMVLPRRRLKPRTYRLGTGQCVLLGGLARVDVVDCPGATMYLTAFMSDAVVSHMGKVEGAEERRAKHTGGLLVPPLEREGLEKIGPLRPSDVVVEGDSWTRSSKDVAIAGLGWVAAGLSGRATLRVWVPEGVAVTIHNALIWDFAKQFQKPGFSAVTPLSTVSKQRAAAQLQQSGVGDGRGSSEDDA